MSLSRRVLVGSAAYLLVGLLLASGVLPPLAAAMLAAPFALIVPTGVGLIVCFGYRGSISPGIGRVQALLFAWLFGTLAIIYVFVLLERWGLTDKFANPGLAAFFALSAGGCIRLRGEFATQLTDWATVRLVVLVALPLVIVQYVVRIPLYSDYPVLDLFQRVHFHKGALEFANFGLLNPFVADSYVPFQQLLLGLLARDANVDPLVAEWVLPVTMAPLQVGAIFSVASCLTKSKKQLGLAISLFLAMSNVTNPTNSDLASLAALLLMSLLLGKEEDKTWCERGGGVLLLLAAIAGALVVVSLPAPAGLVVLLGAGFFVSLHKPGVLAEKVIVVAIVIFVAISFHRAAIMFVALTVVIQFAVEFLSGLQRRGNFLSLAIISFALVLIVGGMAGWILFHGAGLPRDEFGLWGYFDFLLGPLVGKSMAVVTLDGDTSKGSGGRISLFEMARSITYTGSLLCGLLFLRAMWRGSGVRYLKVGGTKPDSSNIALMITCLLLMGVALTGFPFIHRSAFMIAALLSIALAVFVYPAGAAAAIAARPAIAISIGLVGCMGGLLALLLQVRDPSIKPFLEPVFPLLVFLFAVGGGTACWCIRGSWTIGLGLLLVIAVLFEMIASHAYFKPYAFSRQTPPEGTLFSHFGHRELATAESISDQLAQGTVLVSDPKTMALISARSGLPSLVAYSNLGTMADATRSELVELLGMVAASAPPSKVCSRLLKISSLYASSQLNYERLRRQGLSSSGREVLAVLGYNGALVARFVGPLKFAEAAKSTIHKSQPFAIVISPDTLDWLAEPSNPSYFPAQRDVSEIADVFQLYGSNSHLVGDAYLLLVKCE